MKKHFTRPNVLFLICALVLNLNVLGKAPKLISLDIVYDKTQLILPSEEFKIGIIAHFDNGRITGTRGMENGFDPWKNYKVKVAGGVFSSGKITVNKKLLPTKGKYIKVTAHHKKYPDIIKSTLIPLNFETDLKIRPSASNYLHPGVEFAFVITTSFDNGVSRNTLSKSKEDEIFNYEMVYEGFLYTAGKFKIHQTNSLKIEKKPTITFCAKRNPEVQASFTPVLQYAQNQHLLFKGLDGMNGMNGKAGSDGNFNKRNGLDGMDGTNGQTGKNSADIGVWVDHYYDSLAHCDLLYIVVENYETKKEYKYKIAPNIAQLTIATIGGIGGNGGNGGNGFSFPYKGQNDSLQNKLNTLPNVDYSSSDNNTTPPYHIDGGNGGDGGDAGMGSIGGKGGNFYVHFTKDALPFRDKIILKNNGGEGGKHGTNGMGGHGGLGLQNIPVGKHGIEGKHGYYMFGNVRDGDSGELFFSEVENFVSYTQNKVAEHQEE